VRGGGRGGCGRRWLLLGLLLCAALSVLWLSLVCPKDAVVTLPGVNRHYLLIGGEACERQSDVLSGVELGGRQVGGTAGGLGEGTPAGVCGGERSCWPGRRLGGCSCVDGAAG
jgi:hypothetical protein